MGYTVSLMLSLNINNFELINVKYENNKFSNGFFLSMDSNTNNATFDGISIISNDFTN